jgi:hypothetical protein
MNMDETKLYSWFLGPKADRLDREGQRLTGRIRISLRYAKQPAKPAPRRGLNEVIEGA